MIRSVLILAICIFLSSCGGVKSSPQPEALRAIISSQSCFHGWVSNKNNVVPTGYCKENIEGQSLYTYVEVDFPTQRLYIHGSITGLKSTSFRFDVTSCEDIEGGWTVVNGVNPSTGEKYQLRQREIKEIAPTGQAKQAFQGEAQLSVGLNGQTHGADLSCIRYVF